MAIIPSSPIKKAKFKHSTPRWRNRIVIQFLNKISKATVAIYKGVTLEYIKGVVRRFKL